MIFCGLFLWILEINLYCAIRCFHLKVAYAVYSYPNDCVKG
jgi:hypothetical protein